MTVRLYLNIKELWFKKSIVLLGFLAGKVWIFNDFIFLVLPSAGGTGAPNCRALIHGCVGVAGPFLFELCPGQCKPFLFSHAIRKSSARSDLIA
jgi:hypothetical protein